MSERIGPAPTANSNTRLLLAGRLTHALKRGHAVEVDLTLMLSNEKYCRELFEKMQSLRDQKINAQMLEFQTVSEALGLWQSTAKFQQSRYINPDGTVSAAAAWDPAFNPPEAPSKPDEPEIIREPTLSTRVNTAVPSRANSSFLSRLGLTKPPPDASTLQHTKPPPTQTQPHTTGDAAVDAANKKYIRGAR